MKSMMPVCVHAALILTAAVAVGLVASMTWAAPKEKEAPVPGFAWTDGAEVYSKVCALCHETNVGPVLRGRGLDPLYIRLIVRNGDRAMPAFRASEIDDKSLEQLAEYVANTPADK
jgi:mono/diheme cytochrome c family protein